jgi:DNA-binding NarL/FixJ family response regulator
VGIRSAAGTASNAVFSRRIAPPAFQGVEKVETGQTMGLWIAANSAKWNPSWPLRMPGRPRMTEQPPAESALDIALQRETPRFFVIDDHLKIIFHTASQAQTNHESLPETVEQIARGLIKELKATGQPSAIAIMSPSEVVRLLRLEAEDGAHRYAVLLERFAARSSVTKAAKQYGLSARETEVLDGLMRGESTSQISRSLGIAVTTVQEHIRNIGHKTNVTRRSAIVATVFGLR